MKATEQHDDGGKNEVREEEEEQRELAAREEQLTVSIAAELESTRETEDEQHEE